MKLITLESELNTNNLYLIEDIGPYQFLHFSNNYYTFKLNSNQKHISKEHIQKLIQAQLIFEKNFIATIIDYPNLDELTYSLHITETKTIWENKNVLQKLTRSELLELDDLCRKLNLTEMPPTESIKYNKLIREPLWPIFKKYIKTISNITLEDISS